MGLRPLPPAGRRLRRRRQLRAPAAGTADRQRYRRIDGKHLQLHERRPHPSAQVHRGRWASARSLGILEFDSRVNGDQQVTEADSGSRFLETNIRPDELMVGQQQRTLNDTKLLLKYKAQFIDVACPACTSREEAKTFVKFGLRHAECGKCQTTYVNPRP